MGWHETSFVVVMGLSINHKVVLLFLRAGIVVN